MSFDFFSKDEDYDEGDLFRLTEDIGDLDDLQDFDIDGNEDEELDEALDI